MTLTPRDWYAVIGEVVVTAANVEAVVGTLLAALVEGRDDGFHPWSIGALIEAIPKQFPRVRSEELRLDITAVMERLPGVFEGRNDVVHGWWSFAADGTDALRGRAKASPRNPGSGLAVRHVTFDDMNKLLVALDQTRRDVHALIERVIAERA